VAHPTDLAGAGETLFWRTRCQGVCRPVLVALRGMPGVGKSALARALGHALGWPLLDKDDFKHVLYGHTDQADWLAYDLVFHLARRQLELGLSVVCDSPLLHPGLYAAARRTADQAGARLAVIDCVLTDQPEHRPRIESRGSIENRPVWALNDWDALVAYQQRTLPHASFPIDAPRLTINLEQPVQAAAAAAVAWLQGLAESS
jgi:predicted kinase